MSMEALPYFAVFVAMWIIILYLLYYFTVVRSRISDHKKEEVLQIRRMLRKFAAPFMLRHLDGGDRHQRLAGKFEGFSVKIMNEFIGDTACVRFSCAIDAPRWEAFSLSRKNPLSGAVKALGFGDEETGDPDFDGAMVIRASDFPSLAAFLDRITRGRILRLAHGTLSLVITESEIMMEASTAMINSGMRRADHMSTLIFLAEKLSRPFELKENLLAAIKKEKVPAAKARQLGALAARFPGDAGTVAVMKSALRESDPELRITAAKFLGAPAMESLLALVKPGTSLLAGQLEDIIALFAEHRYREGIPFLVDLYGRTDPPRGIDLRPGILDAFHALGDPSLGAFLVDRLNDPNSSIQKAAVRALETCGGISAVEPLVKLERSAVNPFLKQEIRAAVAGIQSRLGSVERGWLSDTDMPVMEGALSAGNGAGDGSLSIDGGTARKKSRGNNEGDA